MATRRRLLLPAQVVLAGVLLLAPPAGAQSGGVEAGETLLVAEPAVTGSPARFSRTLGPTGANRRVAIQGLGPGGVWVTLSRTTADGDGRFVARWTPRVAGRWRVRALAIVKAPTAAAIEPPSGLLTVYRRAGATWYDQSGTRAACGVRLRKNTLGVAHRTLPCGTRVEFLWREKTITVPVIDRGPFVTGLHYDLTIAAAKVLGFVTEGRVRIGVLPNPDRRPGSPIRAFAPLPALPY